MLATIVFCGLGVLVVARQLVETAGWTRAALCLFYGAAMITLQLRFFSRPVVSYSRGAGYLALLIQGCLAYLPLAQFGSRWTVFLGFFAASVLLVGKFAVSLPLSVVVAASGGAFAALDPEVRLPVLYSVVQGTVLVVVVGLGVYALSRLACLVGELQNQRKEVADRAIAEERRRFSRDTHDILGLSLSAITLKSELTNKLIGEHPLRAKAELAEIVHMSRQALADVRSVAAGCQELSLRDECKAAGVVLRAAQVDVRVAVDGSVPARIATTFATVLREAVTNVLRHSKAEWCEITVCVAGGMARMSVVNDGVPPEALEDPHAPHGAGLRNLSYRVAQLGGKLEAGIRAGKTHRLAVSIPLDR